MRKTITAMTAIAAAGCGPLPVATDLSVRHFDRGGLTTCVLYMNWSPEQTTAACGEPVRKVDRYGDRGGFCFIYENVSRALRIDSAPAPFMAACFEEQGASQVRDRMGKLQPLTAGPRLTEVIGLARAQ